MHPLGLFGFAVLAARTGATYTLPAQEIPPVGGFYQQPQWQEQLLSQFQPTARGQQPQQEQLQPLSTHLAQISQPMTNALATQSQQTWPQAAPSFMQGTTRLAGQQKLLLSQLSTQIESALGQADKAAQQEEVHERNDEAVTNEMAQLAASMEKVADLQRASSQRQEELQEQIRTIEQAQRNFAANQERIHQEEKNEAGKLMQQAVGQAQTAQQAQWQLRQQSMQQQAALAATMQQKQHAQAMAANQAQVAATMQAQAQAAQQTAEQSAQRSSTLSNALASTANLMQNVASLSMGAGAAAPAAATPVAPAAFQQSWLAQPQVQQPAQVQFQQQQAQLAQFQQQAQLAQLQQEAQLQQQAQLQQPAQLAQMGYQTGQLLANPAVFQPQAQFGPELWDLRGAAPPNAMLYQQQPPEVMLQAPQGSYGFMNWLGLR